ncbi:MAG: flagellin FliC [Magnetococcus sp. YQC-5]
MPLTIDHSIVAMQARSAMNRHTHLLSKTFSRLASGLRVLSSRDDAAGLAIVSRMTAQIQGINTAKRNINDGLSMMQVAENALDGTTQALQKIRELALQSANDTHGSGDRANLSLEKDQLISEIQRIAVTTQYNGIGLLNGISNLPYFQTQGGVDGGSRTSFQTTFQVGADAGETIVINMALAHVSALGLGKNGSLTSILTMAGADRLLPRIDNALDSVAVIRANLSAIQNRFENMIANLENLQENTDAARSRIQDADIAMESTILARTTILQQVGISILAQANQHPTIAMQLLDSDKVKMTL